MQVEKEVVIDDGRCAQGQNFGYQTDWIVQNPGMGMGLNVPGET